MDVTFTHGLAQGDRLALLSHNCWEYVVLAFAAARLGVVLVPVNFMLGADEVAYILKHSGAAGIIAEDALAGTADKALHAAGVTDPLKGWIGSSGASPCVTPTSISPTCPKGYYGASPMPVEVLRELQRRLPDVQLWNFYGQTEMAPLATILRPHEQLDRAGSAGKASLNVEILLVDDYYNDEAKTADTYRGGWFHSGDLGVMTDEVEETIYELDGVAEVAVFGISHPHWIEAVTAVIVPKAGAALTADEVHAHARARLAGFKRPKYVVFTNALPKNPSGKILKRDLRQQHAHLAEG